MDIRIAIEQAQATLEQEQRAAQWVRDELLPAFKKNALTQQQRKLTIATLQQMIADSDRVDLQAVIDQVVKR